MADPITIRTATVADCAAINDIYNHYVLHDTCTYQTEPDSLAEREAWLARHGGVHPALVAQQAGEVVAWGALSAFHPRAAYRFSVEDSIYVRNDRLRHGLGRSMLAELLKRASAQGHHTVIALISADKAGSVSLHEQFGFTRTAELREAGYKFEKWLDVVFMQLML
ncbi:MAG: N-acetyltransferase family protein [Polyangiaceae bacterium]